MSVCLWLLLFVIILFVSFLIFFLVFLLLFFFEIFILKAYRANLVASLSVERRFCSALEQAESALVQNPTSGPLRLLAARAARELGRFDVARMHIKVLFLRMDGGCFLLLFDLYVTGSNRTERACID